MKKIETLYELRRILDKIVDGLFIIKDNKSVSYIDLKGELDWVTPEAHGVMSFSPQEQLELDNLKYGKNEQGKSYFDVFVAICVQCGVQMGMNSKMETIVQLKKELKWEEKFNLDLTNKVTELQLNQMPQGGLEGEVTKLREEIIQLKKENSALGVYKTAFETMTQTINFWKKK